MKEAIVRYVVGVSRGVKEEIGVVSNKPQRIA